MKITQSQREVLEKYRRWFPENSKGKDDIELLLFRGVITQKQADELRYDKPVPKAKVVKISSPRIRPYTSKQFEKLCQTIRNDTQSDMKDMWESTEGESWWQSACYDIADNMLLEPIMDRRLIAYLDKSQVKQPYWKEYLANELYG